ncbi:NADPH-dependent FMN reductase [Lacticaseibacillus kribbianus]|uniref:NADPH-dependent FMN reductase n=1 Tax=Lacticaseibacillus kribbianus TaxID=2926292 RepID=UPI001CD66D56|nr:NAD(P)H-dependent oxidoreductase [Lacticaseibacillus kribbianus]
MPLKLGIILGTIRSQSIGGKLFAYLQATWPDQADVHYDWIDLHNFPLPLYDHAETPAHQPVQNLVPGERAWLDALAAQDGYLIISPEYDHAMTGALKNALDYVGPEVARKPVQIVTYSHDDTGGIMAAESMVNVFRMLDMLVLPKPVCLARCDRHFTVDGRLDEALPQSADYAHRLAVARHDLAFYAGLLHDHPYSPLG